MRRGAPPGAFGAKTETPDTREVDGGGKRRKRRRSPADQRRTARRAAQRAAVTGDYTRIRALEAVKRVREGVDEGAPFERPAGKTGADDVIAARPNRQRKGEVPPVVHHGA